MIENKKCSEANDDKIIQILNKKKIKKIFLVIICRFIINFKFAITKIETNVTVKSDKNGPEISEIGKNKTR